MTLGPCPACEAPVGWDVQRVVPMVMVFVHGEEELMCLMGTPTLAQFTWTVVECVRSRHPEDELSIMVAGVRALGRALGVE